MQLFTEPSDNLHVKGGPSTLWSRVNAAEAQPGVSTPMSWDFWDAAGERAMRGSWSDLGVLRHSEIAQPAAIDERVWATFYGRVALNVEFVRMMSDRTPGASGNDLEKHILGSVRPDAVSRRSRSRYPIIATKGSIMLRRLPALIQHNYVETHRWWQDCLFADLDLDVGAARARWHEALRRFEHALRVHCRDSNLAQRAYADIASLGVKAGLPGIEITLSGGYSDTEDVAVMRTLWDVGLGRTKMDEFLRQYGYHGPAEGQLAVPTWREDATPLRSLLDSYATMSDEQSPLAIASRRAAERTAAEQKLLDRLSPRDASMARKVLRKLHLAIRLRERGKATYPQAIDVARASARLIGADLARRGALDAPEDVFFLLQSEVINLESPNLKEIVEFRRSRYNQYRALDLPDTWIGNPVPGALQRDARGESVRGLGAGPGRVQGVAHVIVDPDGQEQLQPGEILICHTTDPSWCALMLVASALVIDVGGPISHGAIIARELGIPCVINTKNGTRALRTGDVILVDGSTGVVERVTEAGDFRDG